MSPSPHNFRYELELCTLPEGATLAEWRLAAKADGAPAEPKPAVHARSGLVGLLRRRRRRS